MCPQDRAMNIVTELIKDTFKLQEGTESFIVYCLDDSKHYGHAHASSGTPLKTLELHSHDDMHCVATVFACRSGRRFLIMFDLADVRPV